MNIIGEESIFFCLSPGNDFLELFLYLVEGLYRDLPARTEFVLPGTDPVDEEVVDVVDYCVFVVCFGDQLQHVLVVFSSQVQPDDVETVVEEGREDARFGVALLGGNEDVVWVDDWLL